MDHPIALQVIEAVAETDGVDPLELETALQECISVGALERLAIHDNTSWTLSFEFADHQVTVTGDGRILVDGTRAGEWNHPTVGDGGVSAPDLPPYPGD